MKNNIVSTFILALLVGACMIQSCGSTKPLPQPETIKYDDNSESSRYVKHFTYHNHKYIQFGEYAIAIVHDPDCDHPKCQGR